MTTALAPLPPPPLVKGLPTCCSLRLLLDSALKSYADRCIRENHQETAHVLVHFQSVPPYAFFRRRYCGCCSRNGWFVANRPDGGAPKVKPERGGGYELSEHVKQYYKTARV